MIFRLPNSEAQRLYHKDSNNILSFPEQEISDLCLSPGVTVHDLCLLELVKSQGENVCQACASSGVLSSCATSWLDFLCFVTLTVFIAQGVCRYFGKIQILEKSSILRQF